jgi:hypothetical protein
MKYIALILGITYAALAQQPTEPTPKLYICAPKWFSGPGPTADLMKRCPDVVTVTIRPEAAQYQLDLNWYYGGWSQFHYKAVLYKAGDSLAAFDAKATKTQSPNAQLAEQVCKYLETNKGKQP